MIVVVESFSNKISKKHPSTNIPITESRFEVFVRDTTNIIIAKLSNKMPREKIFAILV
jgi:hypothetical protein